MKPIMKNITRVFFIPVAESCTKQTTLFFISLHSDESYTSGSKCSNFKEVKMRVFSVYAALIS
jgi:hypothetical protein